MDFLNRNSDSSYRDKIIEYRNALLRPDSSAFIAKNHVEAAIVVEQFPIIKFIVEYSDKTFAFYIVGTDGRIFADKTPSIVDKFLAWFH